MSKVMMTRRFPIFSLTAFLVSIAIWIASFFNITLHSDETMNLEGGWSFYCQGGRFVASRSNLLSSYISIPATPSLRNLGGFSYERKRFGSGGMVGGKIMSEHLAIPLYPVPLILGVVLLWRVLRNRTVPGYCPKCGYDLRATPDRCPECGTVARSEADLR